MIDIDTRANTGHDDHAREIVRIAPVNDEVGRARAIYPTRLSRRRADEVAT